MPSRVLFQRKRGRLCWIQAVGSEVQADTNLCALAGIRLPPSSLRQVWDDQYSKHIQWETCLESCVEIHEVAHNFVLSQAQHRLQGDLQWVCYPLFLQCLADSDEAASRMQTSSEMLRNV